MNYYDTNRSSMFGTTPGSGFGLISNGYQTQLGVNPNYVYTGKPENFSDVVNRIEQEERTAKMAQNPWEKPARVMGGLSAIAGGSDFGKAAGLASMFGNENNPTADNVAGTISDVGGIAQGDGFSKVGAMGNLMGNQQLAGTMGQVGQWQDPKSALMGMATKGVGGPVGMVIGMAAQKAMDDTSLRQNVAQGEYNTERQVEQGRQMSLREQQLANMKKNQQRQQQVASQSQMQMPFGNALFGGIV